MRLFKPLYEFALRWSRHRHASYYLAGLSFVEAFIFPVAPEIMLAPMTLGKPRLWARFATISLAGSVAGAFVGYALGHFAFDLVRPFLDRIGWMTHIDSMVEQLRGDMREHAWQAFWLLVLGGLLPIPLKVFTWASGIVGVPLPAFVAAMLIGRGKRVYLLCGLIRLGGERVEQALHRWIEWIGWVAVVALLALVLYLRFLH